MTWMPKNTTTTPAKKYVSKEYHEGQNAYTNGFALTTNPYLKGKTTGNLWYWIFGWQDAMAEDLQAVKRVLLNIVQPADRDRMN